jgi:cation transport regulator
MPYRKVGDLPKEQTDQYNKHQKKAFLEAFNSAYEQYGHDESRAFAVAHSAAKKAGARPDGEDRPESTH